MQIREQQVLFHEGGHERRGKQSFFTLYLPPLRAQERSTAPVAYCASGSAEHRRTCCFSRFIIYLYAFDV